MCILTVNSRVEYAEKIESLKKAWTLVSHMLKTHSRHLNKHCVDFMVVCNYAGRLRLEDQHILPMITGDTPLEYLIPTTSGAGALTTALVDYLILTHNDFIEKCSSRVAERKDM